LNDGAAVSVSAKQIELSSADLQQTRTYDKHSVSDNTTCDQEEAGARNDTTYDQKEVTQHNSKS